MTYATNFAAIEQVQSAELYKMTVGGGVETYFYTSYDEVVVFQGQNYLPISIQRSGFSIDQALKAVTVTIAVPIESAMVQFLSSAPFMATDIEVYHVYLDVPDTNYAVRFRGAIHGVTIEDQVAKASCLSMTSNLKRKIPTILYQTTCNHFLFDSKCTLLSEDWVIDETVALVDGSEITLSNKYATNTYVGGVIQFGGDWRLITSQVEDVFTVLIGFGSMEAGHSVKIYPGCDGTPQKCQSYFDNITHYLGMPGIPVKNAVIWGFR